MPCRRAAGRSAWYDPAQPVTIAFTRIGGEREEIQGVLPLHHSMVLDDAEWRFKPPCPATAAWSTSSADRCIYPEAPPMAQGSADP